MNKTQIGNRATPHLPLEGRSKLHSSFGWGFQSRHRRRAAVINASPPPENPSDFRPPLKGEVVEFSARGCSV